MGKVVGTVTVMTLCAATAHAQSSVTIYGSVDSGLELSNAGYGTQKRVVSGVPWGNRLGFSGSEDLGGGLRAVFNLEMGLTIDDGNLAQGGRGFGREAMVGLSSTTWGTLSMGRLQTPYFYAEFVGDAFARAGTGGTISVAKNAATTNYQLFPLAVAGRADNAVNYTTPLMAGLELRALAAPGESAATVGRQLNVSARYTLDKLQLGAAVADQKAGVAGEGYIRARYFGGAYDFGAFKLFSGYKVEQNACASCVAGSARVPGLAGANKAEFNMFNVGARMPVGAFTLMAQATRLRDRSDYTVDPGNRDATWLSLGAEYRLSKRTNLYTYVGTINNRNGSNYAVASGTQQLPPGAVAPGNPRVKTLDVGISHRF